MSSPINNNFQPLLVFSPKQLNSPWPDNPSTPQSTKLTDKSLLTIKESLIENFKIDVIIAEMIAKRIFDEQKKLPPNKSTTIPASSDMLPVEVEITANLVLFVYPKIGQGASTNVYSSTVQPTTRHQMGDQLLSPSRPFQAALSRAKHLKTRYSPEKRKLDGAISYALDNGLSRRLVDGLARPLLTFDDSDGRNCALQQLFDCDLTQVRFAERDAPVIAILKTLIPVAGGIMILHEQCAAHRDVKAANILVKNVSSSRSASTSSIAVAASTESTEEEIIGAIGDFGLLRFEGRKAHLTTGTYDYLDPSQFGSAEVCLVNQRRREGVQTIDGDNFAIGFVLFKDVLLPLVCDLCDNDSLEIKDAFEQLKSKRMNGPFTDEQLIKFGRTSNYRVAYHGKENGMEFLRCHPELDVIRKQMKIILSTLTNALSEKEINACIQLTELACLMQEVDLNKRPTIAQMHAELIKILNALQPPQEGETGSSTTDEDTSVGSVAFQPKRARFSYSNAAKFRAHAPTQVAETQVVEAEEKERLPLLAVLNDPLRTPEQLTDAKEQTGSQHVKENHPIAE